jgi:hypothetical protein
MSEPPLVVIRITKTCQAAPTQWEGILSDGRVFYVRYRHGRLSLGIGIDLDDAVHASRMSDPVYEDGTDPLGGWMGLQEMLPLANLVLAPGVREEVDLP